MSTPEAPDPTARFNGRAEYYHRYRPDYPAALVDLLHDRVGLRPGQAAADLGSGTGRFSERLLEAGLVVHAIEPNAEMRAVGEAALGDRPDFHSHEGTAEATGLPDHEVHLVAAAQAFHWFAADAAAVECRRILHRDGTAMLVWNVRDPQGSELMVAYEELLLRHGERYHGSAGGRRDPALLRRFFGHDGYRHDVLAHAQVLDLEGVRGRLISSSYAPQPGNPRYTAMLREAEGLFARHQQGGVVRFPYRTEVFWGPLT